MIAAWAPSSITVTTQLPSGSDGVASRAGDDTAHDGGTGASTVIRDRHARPPTTSAIRSSQPGRTAEKLRRFQASESGAARAAAIRRATRPWPWASRVEHLAGARLEHLERLGLAVLEPHRRSPSARPGDAGARDHRDGPGRSGSGTSARTARRPAGGAMEHPSERIGEGQGAWRRGGELAPGDAERDRAGDRRERREPAGHRRAARGRAVDQPRVVRGDPPGEPGVAVAVDHHVAGGDRREALGVPEAEPRPGGRGPRAAMTVAGGRERLVADRDAHERGPIAGPRRATRRGGGRGGGARACRGEPRGELALGADVVGELGDDHVLAERERGEVERRGLDPGADQTPPDRDRERLVGQLAVELAERRARGVGARDRVGDRIARRPPSRWPMNVSVSGSASENT